MKSGALDRAIRRASAAQPEDVDRCGLCDAPTQDEHAHVLDESNGDLLCTCRACGVLFERDGAGFGHYRLVPRRRMRLSGVPSAELGVPVGLAFFVIGPDGAVVARYPSPVGATEWTVDEAAWAAVTSRCEELASMRPAVEALLINTVGEADEQWLVPVDDCYRLVAVIRRSWTGMSGGRQVWTDIGAFFDGLTETKER